MKIKKQKNLGTIAWYSIIISTLIWFNAVGAGTTSHYVVASLWSCITLVDIAKWWADL